jgi:hypothetical protein
MKYQSTPSPRRAAERAMGFGFPQNLAGTTDVVSNPLLNAQLIMVEKMALDLKLYTGIIRGTQMSAYASLP